jgi:hypothetical protein
MLKKLALPSWKELFEKGERFAERELINRAFCKEL